MKDQFNTKSIDSELNRPKLNTPEAAEYIGFSRYALESWRVSGKGPRFHKIGRLVKYSEADLIEFVNQNVCQSTAEYRG